MLAIETLREMKAISADGHVTEPPDIFKSRIDPKYRDIAPYGINHETRGALYIVEGISPVATGGACSAGIPADKLKLEGRTFEAMYKGGWDARARIPDMDRDGVWAELIYPSVGMAICDVPDIDYKRACMQAYNRWLQEFCAGLPDRLFGIGMCAAKDPDTMVQDIVEIKRQGFYGIMLPVEPGTEDYNSPSYDKAWAKAVELDLPICFHILVKRTKEGNAFNNAVGIRGGKMNTHMMAVRLLQDILGVMVFGGVFDRTPGLKVVSVEADAGWAPHFIYRAEHYYKRHRHWLQGRELRRLPSEVFDQNIWLTFQDDPTAFYLAQQGKLNASRLLWASDYPHSDATWPDSMQIVAEETVGIESALVKKILHDNTRDLFNLKMN